MQNETTKTTEKQALILRDKLALDRTRLANQRTLLSYVRTGIVIIATAIGIAHLNEEKTSFGWVEWSLTVVGTAFVIIGLVNYLVMRKKVGRVYGD